MSRKDPQGLVLDALLTMQYRQALRVSEACALHWEDVRLDLRTAENSVIRVSRHIECRSYAQAQHIHEVLSARLRECGLELHEGKTHVVYTGPNSALRAAHVTSFDFSWFHVSNSCSEEFIKTGSV